MQSSLELRLTRSTNILPFFFHLILSSSKSTYQHGELELIRGFTCSSKIIPLTTTTLPNRTRYTATVIFGLYMYADIGLENLLVLIVIFFNYHLYAQCIPVYWLGDEICLFLEMRNKGLQNQNRCTFKLIKLYIWQQIATY